MDFEKKPEGFSSPKNKSKENLDKESQRPLENPIEKLLKENAVNDNIDKIVKNYHIYLKIINILLILFNVMFTEYLW